jgi:arsenate reductase
MVSAYRKGGYIKSWKAFFLLACAKISFVIAKLHMHDKVPYDESRNSMINSEGGAMVMEKTTVLFVCVHNSARSKMAEAFLKKQGGEEFEVESAGFEPGEINPLVIEVMREVGIDISNKSTQSVFDLYKKSRLYSYVITVCDAANAQRCPLFPGFSVRLSWSFDDPADFTGSDDEKFAKTRVVRDQIQKQVEDFIRNVRKVSST